MHFFLVRPDIEYAESAIKAAERFRQLPEDKYPDICGYRKIVDLQSFFDWRTEYEDRCNHTYYRGIWLIVLDDVNVDDTTVVGFLGGRSSTFLCERNYRDIDFAILPEYETIDGYMALCSAWRQRIIQTGRKRSAVWINIIRPAAGNEFKDWVISHGGAVELLSERKQRYAYKVPVSALPSDEDYPEYTPACPHFRRNNHALFT